MYKTSQNRRTTRAQKNRLTDDENNEMNAEREVRTNTKRARPDDDFELEEAKRRLALEKEELRKLELENVNRERREVQERIAFLKRS